MKKIYTSLALLLLVTSAYCKIWTITNDGFTFSPSTITITEGDSIMFDLGSIHDAIEVSEATWNVNGNTALPGFATEVGGGLVLPDQLTVGIHYYVCEFHVGSGMKGTITVEKAAGIDENSLSPSLQVYPNPTFGKINIQYSNPENATNYNLEVYDMLGKKVFGVPDLKQEIFNEYDFSDYPKGIYFVRIINQGKIIDKKIVML